ncbi:hypothetical protein E2C01_009733 [Portunus trituberculatus]|uniref:Uncharacterized protein n=1 Tax=Portunus trituberculatus TaxID=210409 RepID=A0A5B7D6J8_PORTR|nr:hypothetical protein [Portunus trituberculatus]
MPWVRQGGITRVPHVSYSPAKVPHTPWHHSKGRMPRIIPGIKMCSQEFLSSALTHTRRRNSSASSSPTNDIRSKAFLKSNSLALTLSSLVYIWKARRGLFLYMELYLINLQAFPHILTKMEYI